MGRTRTRYRASTIYINQLQLQLESWETSIFDHPSGIHTFPLPEPHLWVIRVVQMSGMYVDEI